MAYPKAASLMGYNTRWLTDRNFYKPNNGYMLSGNQRYAPFAPARGQILTLTFTAAPADGKVLTVLDGVPNSPGTPALGFTYTYGGSPGAGIIPLVGGGGTAAQAATATQVALAAQVTNWIVTNPSAGVVQMQSRFKGLNLTVAQVVTMLGTIANLTIALTNATQALVVPGRAGFGGATLPA